MEGRVVVAPAELYLETLVPAHVGGQPGQALLARASHAHQEGIAPRLTNHASYSVGGGGWGEKGGGIKGSIVKWMLNAQQLQHISPSSATARSKVE